MTELEILLLLSWARWRDGESCTRKSSVWRWTNVFCFAVDMLRRNAARVWIVRDVDETSLKSIHLRWAKSCVFCQREVQHRLPCAKCTSPCSRALPVRAAV